MQSSMLSKDDILAAKDVITDVVEVPEWGGNIRIRSMTGKMRDRYETELAKQMKGEGKGITNLRALFLSFCIVDDYGKQVFQSPGDVNALGEKNGQVLDRIFDAAAELNHIGTDGIEDAAKN